MRGFARTRTLAGVFAAAALMLLVVGNASAQGQFHGIAFTKGCTGPTTIGQPLSCAYQILNVVDQGQDTLQVNDLTDVVHAASGDVSSGNILGAVQLVFSSPTVSCIGGSGAGTAGSPYVGATQCTLPFGTSITTNGHSFYTVQPLDFTLPGPPPHTITDTATLGWNNTCTAPGVQNCTTTAQQASAGSSSLVAQLPSTTATAIHNAAHAVVTAVAVGTNVHDFVAVSGGAGNPIPTGSVTVDWFLNGTCAGAPAATSAMTPLGPAGTVDVTGFNFTVSTPGMVAFLAHYQGDPANPAYTPSDGPCEPLQVVDANIQITPATATNPVNTNHTLTGHVNVNTGAGFVNAPDGTVITFTIASGPGSFVGGVNTCTTAGGTGSCTVAITSATAGTTMVHATTDVTVAGVVLHRETDGQNGNSGDAQKIWINPNANIQISPQTATNPVGTNHTLTGHVNVAPDGVTFVNAPDGTVTTFTITGGPGSFVGPSSCTTAGGTGSCTVVITSATAGVTTVKAATDVTVSGVVLHRETGDANAGDSPNATKNWVDANIQITPANATNPVGTNHTLTGHVNVNSGAGFVNAPDGTVISFSLTNAGGATATFVGPSTCTTAGGTGSCTVVITSPTAGTTTVTASTTVSVNGVPLTRTTSGSAGNSGPATKVWLDSVVTTRVLDASNTEVTNTTVPSGTVVHDEATVAATAAGGPTPTGTVTFTLFNSNNCTGTVVATDPNKPLNAGVATSATFTTPNAGGMFSYLAHYNGDANFPAHDGPCEPFQVNAVGGAGRVTGGGSIFWTVNGVPNTRITHGEELRCDPSDPRQSLEINWAGGNNFHLSKLINSVVCFDDPTVQPPPPPGTVIDTYAGNSLFNGHTGYHGFGYAVGTGTCNGLPATIYFIFSDAGEPGTGDVAEYHITGGCTLDVGPALIDKGNVQFHKS